MKHIHTHDGYWSFTNFYWDLQGQSTYLIKRHFSKIDWSFSTISFQLRVATPIVE